MCAEQAQLQELKLQQYCETRNYGRSSSHDWPKWRTLKIAPPTRSTYSMVINDMDWLGSLKKLLRCQSEGKWHQTQSPNLEHDYKYMGRTEGCWPGKMGNVHYVHYGNCSWCHHL
jgi:hypothetical protein